MDYLRILEQVRAVTGNRADDRFPAAESPRGAFLKGNDSPATFLVFDAQTAKRILESPAYRQFPFLDRILTIAKPERTHWIRRFCEVGLIMIDGPEHERRRARMAATLDRCIDRLKQLPAEKTALAIEQASRSSGASADRIARALVCLLFSESIAAIIDRDIELPQDDLFQIDFFNPFPTLSSLARCNASIDVCCKAAAMESLDADDQSAVLSMLIMGVSPLHALITASLNQCLQARESGSPLAEALALAAKVDSYAIVPTNFVMRECCRPDSIDGEAVAVGDIVYLFLGSATGCPFSRQSAVPFGAGAHYCSGAKLTSVMMWAVRAGLAAADPAALNDVAIARPEQGKASAFLMFPPPAG
jgi:cytochrome P450